MTEESRPVFEPAALLNLEIEKAVDVVIGHAAQMRASDLYLLAREQATEISIRRFGIVQQVTTVSRDLGRQYLSHVKAMAGMDISDHRRPAEGRWLHNSQGRQLDLRVSTIATLFGEDLTLRIWDREFGLRRVDQLGMMPADLKKLKSLLTRPSGLILVTGPTGTGKTTTLYACLQYLKDAECKINTIEDPVEYAIDGIRQSQVVPKIGVDYPELLRNVLRQAPDIIMIGEIRDEETAAAAIRAANSGHLVLSTLHAPIAASAVQSMLALGSRPYFLSSCLLGIVAQRLVRTLCPHCRMRYDISESPQTFSEIKELLGEGEGDAIFGPGGCDQCFHTGYGGRTGLFEIMTLNQEIRKMLADSRPVEELEHAAIRNGMIEFRRGALLKVAQGLTSTEEILRDVPAEYLGIED